MKKFTIAAAALCVTAAAFAQSPLENVALQKSAQAPDYSSYTWKDLGEGKLKDFVLCNLFVGFFNEPVTVQVQESEQKPGVYRVLKPWTNPFESVKFNDELNQLIIDASDPDYVMVPQQQSPVDTADRGETWYCSYSDWAVNVVDNKELFLEYSANLVPKLEDGVIKFPLNCMAVMYPYAEVDGIPAGSWTYANMEYEGYLALPESSGYEEWTDLGVGRFLDGFLEPTFDPDYVPEELELHILENKNVPGVYKVADAFKHSSKTGQDPVIDARDPNFVRIELQNTGVNTTNGWLYMMSVSFNGTYTTYEEMINEHPDYAERNITKDDKGIYIPTNSILFTFPTSGDLTAYPTTNAYPSYVLFPDGGVGVDSVGAEDADAPAEYFNLQGMRINTPCQGELVIVRKGNKSYKTVIR